MTDFCRCTGSPGSKSAPPGSEGWQRVGKRPGKRGAGREEGGARELSVGQGRRRRASPPQGAQWPVLRFSSATAEARACRLRGRPGSLRGRELFADGVCTWEPGVSLEGLSPRRAEGRPAGLPTLSAPRRPPVTPTHIFSAAQPEILWHR